MYSKIGRRIGVPVGRQEETKGDGGKSQRENANDLQRNPAAVGERERERFLYIPIPRGWHKTRAAHTSESLLSGSSTRNEDVDLVCRP